MDKSAVQKKKSFSKQAKFLGTVFLLFQLLFAANNYGPQRIPILKIFFSKPWIGENAPDLQQNYLVENSSFKLQDITEGTGLHTFVRSSVNDDNPNYLEVMGGGVAVGDYDGDGWEDLFFTSMPSFEKDQTSPSSTLFRNERDGTFGDVTKTAGLSHIKGYPQGALFFDFDNNGTQDLYVASYQGGQLFRNDNGHFVEITDTAGLDLDDKCGVLPCFTSSATAADYNRDGFLDLLIINNVSWNLNDLSQWGEHQLFPAFFQPQPSILFRNNGDGTFVNATEESNLSNKDGKGLSAVWSDINNDNWPDVYIANDLSRNRLYINSGDGSFTELGAGTNLDEIKSSMGVTAADFDNDGDEDFAVTNLKGSKLSLFKNLGDYRFEYATDHSGLTNSRESTGWGISFIDLDLDGYQDLVMSAGPVWEEDPADTRNLFYRNLGNGRFEEVLKSESELSNTTVSRGLAVTDVDRSGTPDLIVANIDGASPQLLKNQSSKENHWVKLNLVGIESNRDAVGARVVLRRADGLRQMQVVRAGDSYQSSGSKSLFFGLANSHVNTLTILWPSGKTDTLQGLPSNTILKIIEGGKVEPIPHDPQAVGND